VDSLREYEILTGFAPRLEIRGRTRREFSRCAVLFLFAASDSDPSPRIARRD